MMSCAFSKMREICRDFVNRTQLHNTHKEEITFRYNVKAMVASCNNMLHKLLLEQGLSMELRLKLVNCSWMSLYVPKLDATCVLAAKAIIHDDVLHIKQVHCNIESCVATCFRLSPSCNSIKYSPFAKVCNLYYKNETHHDLQPNEQIGQSMHLLLHSCHKDISNIPAGIIVQSEYQRNNSAKIHTPSTHKNCDIFGLPFVENFYAQRIQLIATSSLKRCIAFCTAPTYTSCNSVLFSAQQGTCLLLSRARNLPLFGGIIPTLQTSALFFIILTCYNDFVLPNAYTIPRFREIAPIVYSAFNLSVSVYQAQFHATEAGIRLRLWETADESQCLIICLDKFLADYCDGYYFSYGEKTCLTFRIRKIYALPNSPFNRHIIKFSDDGMLIRIVKDQRLISIQYSNHITTEAKRYAQYSIQFQTICRFIRNIGLCQGIAYSKESKVCLIAVLGNYDDEVFLNEGYHFLTLNNCSKDRENERADNDPPELHRLPILDEVCNVELYKTSFLTGWSVIIEILNTTTLQECLSNCAEVMQVKNCSAIYFIDESCILFERMTHLQNHFIRQRASVFAELLFCEPNIR
ncbi:hypothetical protein T07_2149 [Trichinella nelsoni]|uniref:Apple domain-containing protein n=1 Tax=Trichinella nelsoni TaxID=6336 RepID=A0A0V0RG56_9BILA|nr:hypothetical protein T07_2149 [Trichinella nelsoni]